MFSLMFFVSQIIFMPARRLCPIPMNSSLDRFTASIPAFLPFPPHSHQIHHQHSCLPASFTPDSPPAFLPSCLSRRIHTRFTPDSPPAFLPHSHQIHTRFTTSSAFPTGTVS
eukprot:XP_011660387.1 PREDICTED: uncharacterized protein LOC105436495 [Strongylocentrotus purpuratus]